MADKNVFNDQRREQHGAVTFVDNAPAPTVAQALANSKTQVDQAK
jgi:hypothetical protein